MPLSVPKFLTKAFAAAGGKTNVPITGADINNGRADYENGFPPVTRAPIAAGGVPPYGTDMNGVLFDLSSGLQYLQAGMVFPYSQDLANAIGGYDVGALVTASGIRYVSTISGNSLPPPSAGWQALSLSGPTETVRGMPMVATSLDMNSDVAGKMVDPAKIRMGFSFSYTAAGDDGAGYLVLPTWLGGWIFQVGRSVVTRGVAKSYPIAFPDRLYAIFGSHLGSDSNAQPVFTTGTSKTSFVPSWSAAGASLSIWFLAIGK